MGYHIRLYWRNRELDWLCHWKVDTLFHSFFPLFFLLNASLISLSAYWQKEKTFWVPSKTAFLDILLLQKNWQRLVEHPSLDTLTLVFFNLVVCDEDDHNFYEFDLNLLPFSLLFLVI